MSKKKKAPEPTFEESLNQLSEIVRELEQGNLTLDESLARYEQGIQHLGQCQAKLAKAERKIEVLSGFDRDGNPITQRFDDKEMTLQQKAANRSRRRTAQPAASTQEDSGDKENGPPAAADLDEGDVDVNGTLF